jgi:adenylate cyclase
VIAVLGDFNGIIVQQMSRGLTKSKSGTAFLTTQSWYNIFYSRFNEDVFRKAYAAMQYTIEKNPSDELAWAFLGQLSMMAFLFDHPTNENPVVHGLRTARSALKINPLSQHGHIALAMAHISLQNRRAGLDELEHTISLNPNAVGIMGICGCLMIVAGEYDRGIELIRNSMSRNKSHPALFKFFLSLYHFKQKEYSLALASSDEMAIPDFGLNIILRVATLSHMGRKAEAEILIKSLKNLSFNKTWISKEFLSRFLLDEDLVDQIYKGFNFSKIPFLTVA